MQIIKLLGFTVKKRIPVVMLGTLWPTGLNVEDSATRVPSLIAGQGYCIAFLGKSSFSQTVPFSSQVYNG